ncbi:MAG: hypothetical protein K2Y07_08550 [Nitrosomonas sp.]|nr:hypothetical protein [Nitrosomonas sp.]
MILPAASTVNAIETAPGSGVPILFLHARAIFGVRFLVASADHKITKIGEKLLPVITAGKPVDVDVLDPQYLRHDNKKAIEETGRSGILTYCMSLDSRADQYVRAFSANAIIWRADHVERLPEKLPVLYAELTR